MWGNGHYVNVNQEYQFLCRLCFHQRQMVVEVAEVAEEGTRDLRQLVVYLGVHPEQMR